MKYITHNFDTIFLKNLSS